MHRDASLGTDTMPAFDDEDTAAAARADRTGTGADYAWDRSGGKDLVDIAKSIGDTDAHREADLARAKEKQEEEERFENNGQTNAEIEAEKKAARENAERYKQRQEDKRKAEYEASVKKHEAAAQARRDKKAAEA